MEHGILFCLVCKHNGLNPLFQTDLVSTIGESVALGAAGIIMWGDATYNKVRSQTRPSLRCIVLFSLFSTNIITLGVLTLAPCRSHVKSFDTQEAVVQLVITL